MCTSLQVFSSRVSVFLFTWLETAAVSKTGRFRSEQAGFEMGQLARDKSAGINQKKRSNMTVFLD